MRDQWRCKATDTGLTLERDCRGPAGTRAMAAQLAEALECGSVVALYGELGAGKTCFVQGVAAALGVREAVTSPTYTLVNEYTGRVPVYHVDLYRIASPEEALQFDLEAYLEGPGVTLIEWADRVETLLPPHTWRVHIETSDAPDRRRIRQVAGGPPC